MTKILVEHHGDMSVGIFGERVWVEMDLTDYDNDEIEFVRKELKKCFQSIFDFECHVYLSQEEIYPY